MVEDDATGIAYTSLQPLVMCGVLVSTCASAAVLGGARKDASYSMGKDYQDGRNTLAKYPTTQLKLPWYLQNVRSRVEGEWVIRRYKTRSDTTYSKADKSLSDNSFIGHGQSTWTTFSYEDFRPVNVSPVLSRTAGSNKRNLHSVMNFSNSSTSNIHVTSQETKAHKNFTEQAIVKDIEQFSCGYICCLWSTYGRSSYWYLLAFTCLTLGRLFIVKIFSIPFYIQRMRLKQMILRSSSTIPLKQRRVKRKRLQVSQTHQPTNVLPTDHNDNIPIRSPGIMLTPVTSNIWEDFSQHGQLPPTAHDDSHYDDTLTLSAKSSFPFVEKSLLRQTKPFIENTITLQMRENIECISSVLTSSGLNRQSSLKIAAQTIINRLEMDYQHAIRQQEETKKLFIKAQWRHEDHIKEERSLLLRRLEQANAKAWNTAYSLCLGHCLILCTFLSVLIYYLRTNSSFTMALLHDVALGKELNFSHYLELLVASKFCGCKKEGNDSLLGSGTVDTLYWRLYASVPTFSSFVFYMAPPYVYLASCILRVILFGSFFLAIHLFMSKCNFPKFSHQALNFLTIYMSISPSFKGALIANIRFTVFANILIAAGGIACIYLRTAVDWNTPTERMYQYVKVTERCTFSMYLSSIVAALLVGLLV